MGKAKKQKRFGNVKPVVMIRASQEFAQALKELDWGTNPIATKRLAVEVIPFVKNDIEKRKKKGGGGFSFEP